MKLKGIKMPVKKKAIINMNSDNEDDNPKQQNALSTKQKVQPIKKNVDVQNKNLVSEIKESNKDKKEPQRGLKRPNDGSEPKNHKIFRQSFEELEEIKEKLKKESANLPIHKLRKKLVAQALKAKSLVIVGETGSGKTTQVPQLLYRANVCNNKCIAITQPRRVAATTLARRVAAEMGVQLGSKVGYHVRFSNVTNDDKDDDVTKIVFLTDGMLLRESLLDPLLKKYNVVILDEAHERTVETDVLFGIVKSAQKTRDGDSTLDPLKIIVMSATMDVEKFSNYFGAEVFTIPGRTHKIDLFYENKKVKDYVSSCIEKVLEINTSAPADQHVLVFLTGKDEIESAAKVLHRKAMSQDSKLPALVVLPFYSALSQELQEKVFQPVPEGTRKVILSTNLAETSLTIGGIKYVIDSGFSKVKTYDPNRGLDCLKVEPISQAQANQRSGRAGREGPGTCYRMYTEEAFKKFPEVPVPEIQRRSLASVILQLMYMGIGDVTKFDFVDKPSEKAILEAFKVLKDMKAAVVEPNIELTEDGKLMARFPLDPKYGRIIISASKYGCLHEVLIIISVLSSEEAFIDLPEERKGNREKRSPFVDDSGDLLTYLKIFREFNKKDAEFQEAWCKSNGINQRALTFAKSVKEQLKDICMHAGMAYSMLSGNVTTREMVLKSFCSGLYKNVAKFSRDRYILLNSHREAVIHPSSVLYKFKPDHLLFCELVETTGVYMRSVSKIKFDWVQLVAPEGFQRMPFSEPTAEQLKKRKLERKHALNQ